jgi:hypothetical protein
MTHPPTVQLNEIVFASQPNSKSSLQRKNFSQAKVSLMNGTSPQALRIGREFTFF